jgi:hypothetical protein
MKILERFTAQRRRKAHEAYEREQARQRALNEQDVQESMRDVVTGQAGTQQGFAGRN